MSASGYVDRVEPRALRAIVEEYRTAAVTARGKTEKEAEELIDRVGQEPATS